MIRLELIVVTDVGKRVKLAKKSSIVSTSISSIIVTLMHCLGCCVLNVRVVVTLM